MCCHVLGALNLEDVFGRESMTGSRSQLYYDIFAWLYDVLDMPFSPQSVQHSIGNAMAMDDAECLIDWRELLGVMASPLGIAVHPLEMSVSSLREGKHFFPLLASLPATDGSASWLGVWGRERGKFRIRLLSSSEEERWVSERELLAMLGVSLLEEVSWITAESSAPLSSWKGEEESGYVPSLFRKIWPRLLGLMRAEKSEMWTILVFAMAIGLMTLVTPITVQALVNTVSFGTLLQPLVILSLMLAAGLCFLAVLQALQSYLAENISQRVFVRVVADFAHRLPRARQSSLSKHDRAELPNYFFDVLTVQKVLAVLLLDGLSAVLSIVSGLLLLALYHPVLLAFDFLLLVAMLFLIFVLGRGALATSVKESKSKHKTAAWLDRVARQEVYRSHGGMELARMQADVLAQEYLVARNKHFRIVMRQILGGLAIQIVASAGLLLVGGWLVISQQLTLGQLVASELVVSVLLASLFKVVKSFEKYYDLMASLDKLGKVIDLELERDGGQPVPPASEPAALRLVNVSHRSALGEPVLSEVNMAIPPGRSTGILGCEGIGKSALGDMLFGLVRPEQGQIYLDQHLLQDIRPQELRRLVALVRRVDVVDGTILENVRLMRPEVSRLSIRKALHVVGLLNNILTLPDGLHTHISEAQLSPQQEKQLMLARALVGQPALLVIDGLLDSFDAASIMQFFQRLNEWTDEKPTMLVLTNRKRVWSCCESQLQVRARPSSVVSLEQPMLGT
jgi:ABC-type bacteriocin/lantibiotic exporter with double-glycine peptidase domain